MRYGQREMLFITTCVSARGENIRAMTDQAQPISRRTFLRHVNPYDLGRIERLLGYEQHAARGLTMAGDYHVAYFKSQYCGHPCVYFVWSAIEYIFG